MQPDIANSQTTFYVHISTPEKLLYEGSAQALSSVNDKGKFDILPMHENFISLIKDKIIVHKVIGGEKLEFPIEKGVMKVQKNKVFILTGFELLDSNE